MAGLISLGAIGLSAKPLAMWSLDGDSPAERIEESYGTTEFDLTISGSAIWANRDGFGSVLANGENTGYLSSSGSLDFGEQGFSISLWSNRTSSTGSNASGLVDALNGTGTGFQLFYREDESLRFRLDDAAGNAVLVDTLGPQLSLDSWQNIIVTVNRELDRASIHVNGVEETPAGGVDISTLTGAITPDQDFWISSLNESNSARGGLDDIGLFDRVLTAQEIASINAGGGVPLSSLWPDDTTPPSEVIIDPPGGFLEAGQQVSLTSGVGEEIRFTLDGSEPGAGSNLYEAPFVPGNGDEVKARAFSSGGVAGVVVSAQFLSLPDTPPNVLVIVADDLGFNDLGCYGAASVVTPNLDRLAATGCRFTQFTTTGPGDLANQYSLLTGRVAKRSGLPEVIAGNEPGLDPREWSLGEVFRKEDYETAFVGEWHLGATFPSRAIDQGFQLFYGLPRALETGSPLVENGSIIESPANEMTLLGQLENRALEFINEARSDPFFLVFQAPVLATEGTSLLGGSGNRIEALDQSVGALLDAVDGLDNTLIIFISDEGADRSPGLLNTGSNGQFRDGAGTTWEGGVRTPFIVKWPEVIPDGLESRAIIWMPDLFHSLSKIAKGYLPQDRTYDGDESAFKLLAGERNRVDEKQIVLHRFIDGSYQATAIRRGGRKLHKSINNIDPGNGSPTTASSLFDVEIDPSERINLGPSQRSLVLELRRELADYESGFSGAGPDLPPARAGFLADPVYTLEDGENGPLVTISFSRPTDSLNDHYQIEWSDDLEEWAVDPQVDISSEVIANGDEEMVSLSAPLFGVGEASPRRFVRLKSMRP